MALVRLDLLLMSALDVATVVVKPFLPAEGHVEDFFDADFDGFVKEVREGWDDAETDHRRACLEEEMANEMLRVRMELLSQ